MIYIASIYVFICALQLAFTVWRDLKETSRRSTAQELSRQYSDMAADSDNRMATALEGFREEIAAMKRGKP